MDLRKARKPKLLNQPALTLIELLIVIVMIVIISAPTTVIIYIMHITKGDEIEAGLRSQLCLASRALVQDIKNARALPARVDNFVTGSDTLILHQAGSSPRSPESVIYHRNGDRLYRIVRFSDITGSRSNQSVLVEYVKNVAFAREGSLVSFSIETGFTYAQRPYTCSVTSAALAQAAAPE